MPAPARTEAAELVPATLEELHRVQVDANQAELHRARAQVKASLLMSMESTGSRCEQLSRQMQIFGRIVPTAETVAKLEAVTSTMCDAPPPASSAARRRWPPWARRSSVPSLSAIAERLAA